MKSNVDELNNLERYARGTTAIASNARVVYMIQLLNEVIILKTQKIVIQK